MTDITDIYEAVGGTRNTDGSVSMRFDTPPKAFTIQFRDVRLVEVEHRRGPLYAAGRPYMDRVRPYVRLDVGLDDTITVPVSAITIMEGDA